MLRVDASEPYSFHTPDGALQLGVVARANMFGRVCCLLSTYRRVGWIMMGSLGCTLVLAAYFTWRVSLLVDDRFLALAGDWTGDLAGDSVGSLFSPGAEQNCTIFTFWRYPAAVPLFVQLNIASWLLHSDSRCRVIKITDTNVRMYIPDLPPNYFRVKATVAQSDIIRYAVIYHHGGLYLDTDMLVTRSLDPIIRKLGRYEFIGYESGRQACVNGSFSSSFMGGRRGSRFHKAIWEVQKKRLNTPCSHQVFGNPYDRACCPKKETLKCNVPWTSLGEMVAWPAAAELLESTWPRPRMFCFGFNESFSPKNRLAIIHQQKMDLAAAKKYWKIHRIERPLERLMLHLSNAMNPWGRYKNLTQFFEPATVVGDVYIRSFGGIENATAMLEATAATP